MADNDFTQITERIKDFLSHKYPTSKIFDKHVAEELEINQISYASMKKRNSIPYEEILIYALYNKINPNWLFFGIKTSYSEVA